MVLLYQPLVGKGTVDIWVDVGVVFYLVSPNSLAGMVVYLMEVDSV